MSIAEMERFAADLKSNEALRAEADRAKAETSMVAFAATKGYAFTADEVKQYAKAKELTDAELAGVVGGTGTTGAGVSEGRGELSPAMIEYILQHNQVEPQMEPEKPASTSKILRSET